MNRQPVKSSHVVSVGYEPGDEVNGGTLEVEFGGGSIYTYHNVPQHEYDALLKAESVGRHLRNHIQGRFTHRRT